MPGFLKRSGSSTALGIARKAGCHRGRVSVTRSTSRKRNDNSGVRSGCPDRTTEGDDQRGSLYRDTSRENKGERHGSTDAASHRRRDNERSSGARRGKNKPRNVVEQTCARSSHSCHSACVRDVP